MEVRIELVAGWTILNLISTTGAFMIAISILPFLINVIATFINGEPAGTATGGDGGDASGTGGIGGTGGTATAIGGGTATDGSPGAST